MTNKDKKLIEEARRTPSQFWGDIDELIEKADTIEAKRELEYIQRRLYYIDESYSFRD